MAKFAVGDEVQSIRDSSRIGVVVALGVCHAGVQYYQVNWGGGVRETVGELDLRGYVASADPHETLAGDKLGGYQDFQRSITYYRLLRDEPLRNNVYAFNASRTRFFPYQYKPLLKFLESPNHRLLIADEVGLGKTIEAGLILTELSARQTIDRVLVVCPANLRPKWRRELEQRFGEDFRILRGPDLRELLDQFEETPDRVKIRGIASLESLRTASVLERLEALLPDFDLVIVDEGHHMRNFGTLQRRAGVALSRGAAGMLLLTATPIHLGNENLFSLLNLLDEDGFPDSHTVDSRLRANEPIVRAQTCMAQLPPLAEEAEALLKDAARTTDIRNHPAWEEAQSKLQELKGPDVSRGEQRRLVLDIQRDLADLNLIGHIFTRTKKVAVQEHVVTRQAWALRVVLSDRERDFYQAVTDFVRSESRRRVKLPVVQQWMLQMPQRRVASCIPAMVEHYRSHFLFDTRDVPDDAVQPEGNGAGPAASSGGNLDARGRLQDLVRSWPRDAADAKYDALLGGLQELKRDEPGTKTVLFAFFKGTLEYLYRCLQRDGHKCVLLTGDTPPDERGELIDQFRDDPDARVLLSSRVGSEGLDFQFCSVVFNYDLPWNPMEVEQRIGRLDRIGQESPVIRIFNFWLEGTIEERMLRRLYDRIDVFERSIGELEDILGDVISNLERELFTEQLTPDEEEQRIEQAAQVILARRDELRRLENQSAQFIGVDQFFSEEVEKIRDRRRYVTGEQLRRFVMDFLTRNCPRTRMEYDREESRGTLSPEPELQSFLARAGAAAGLPQYMGERDQEIEITFDSETAFREPRVDFLNVLHPLTQAIVREYRENGGPAAIATRVTVDGGGLLDRGMYVFYIFKLTVRAARASSVLEMVVLDTALREACTADEAEHLLGLMAEAGEEARGAALDVSPDWAEKAWARAEQVVAERVDRTRRDVQRTNDAFVDRRAASTRTFFERKLNRQRELLMQAEERNRDERYLRLLRGTIRRLETDLEAQTVELEKQRQVEVGHYEVAAGVLEVASGAA